MVVPSISRIAWQEGGRSSWSETRVALAAPQCGFDEVEAIVAPEQLITDEDRRGAEHATRKCLIAQGAQAILDRRRIAGGEQRIGRQAQRLAHRAQGGVVGEVAIFGPGRIEQRLAEAGVAGVGAAARPAATMSRMARSALIGKWLLKRNGTP